MVLHDVWVSGTVSIKRFVDGVEVLAGVAALVTVVLLLTVSPTEAVEETPSLAAGADLFRANCSSCHGADGEGGVGPSLMDGLSGFETVDDLRTFVSVGSPGRMPGFETRLTPDEINAVVEHVWVNLAGRADS